MTSWLLDSTQVASSVSLRLSTTTTTFLKRLFCSRIKLLVGLWLVQTIQAPWQSRDTLTPGVATRKVNWVRVMELRLNLTQTFLFLRLLSQRWAAVFARWAWAIIKLSLEMLRLDITLTLRVIFSIYGKQSFGDTKIKFNLWQTTPGGLKKELRRFGSKRFWQSKQEQMALKMKSWGKRRLDHKVLSVMQNDRQKLE